MENSANKQEIGTGESWIQLRNGFLKKETEGMMLAAQEQALRINFIKLNIDKTSDTLLSRLCAVSTKTIGYITSGCFKLAQKEYRKIHD